jgi:hypothetical protein
LTHSEHCTYLIDHYIGTQQNRRRQFFANRFGGLSVDRKFEFVCPFDRKICGLRALENLGRAVSCSPEHWRESTP